MICSRGFLRKNNMTMTTITINGTEVKIWPRTIDGHAWQEIGNLASLPFVFRHIALVPDAQR